MGAGIQMTWKRRPLCPERRLKRLENFRPLGKDYPYLIDIPDSDKLDFSEGPVCRINKVEIIPQYIADLPLH